MLRAFKILASLPYQQCEAIDEFIRALPWLSPVLNPLIYSFSGSIFRQHVASLFGLTLRPDMRRIIHRSAILSSTSINPSKLSVSMQRLSADLHKSKTSIDSSSTLFHSSSLLLPGQLNKNFDWINFSWCWMFSALLRYVKNNLSNNFHISDDIKTVTRRFDENSLNKFNKRSTMSELASKTQ